MYKICGVLLIALLRSGCAFGQPILKARPSSGRPATVPAHVRAINRHTGGEPALPDSSTNPVPAAVADRPGDGLLRRRRLRLTMRN